MKPTHTSEPWQLHNNIGRKGGVGIIADAAPCIIATMSNAQAWPVEAYSNAERIVSCVNACQGINPAAVPEIVDALERLLACACPTGMDTETDRAMEQARAALAKAKA